MNIFKKTHEHDLYPVMMSRFGKVEQCRTCHIYFTTMLEYSSGTVTTIPGNYIAVLGSPLIVYVLCGTEEEFEQFKIATNTVGSNFGLYVPTTRLIRLQSENQFKHLLPYQPIYLYGSWKEHDLIDSPELMKLLNGWL
jgi:hypothetical protein